MTTEEALQVLDQAASLVSLPRAGHIQVQQALETIKEQLKPTDNKKAK